MNAVREQARRALQTTLNSAKSEAARNRLGQFATPFELACEILHRAVAMLPSDAEIRFLEPGFGTGAFYSALIHSPFAERVRVARGFEVDPAYAEAAKQLWRGLPLRLTVGDFTKAAPPKTEKGKFNLVACNPPYVRHHHLASAQKRDLQARVTKQIGLEPNGLSGLYAYFMLLSKPWMSEGGVGAWLVPSEFMDVNYGRVVRRFLLEKVTLKAIHRFDPEEVQFEDALVSSAVVFFTNEPPPKNHKIRFSFGGSVLHPRITELVDSKDLSHLEKWTALPRTGRLVSSHYSVETLGDLFTIKRGVATGCNWFFLLTPEKAERYEIPREFLTPILPSPRYLETNEVAADDGGMPEIQRRLLLLNCGRDEDEVRTNYPSLWRYLEHGVAKGIHQRYLCRHRSPWYIQEVRAPAPLLCTYMGRRSGDASPFRFILNWSMATAPNVYLMLYPKGPLSSVLTSDPGLLKKVWKALLDIPGETLIEHGRVYGGGLYKIEPRELGNVPAAKVVEVLRSETKLQLQREYGPFQGKLF